MGWIKDCLEIATDLVKSSKKRKKTALFQARVQAVHTELLRPNCDLTTADELLRLAREAEYDGAEVDALERRLATIRAYNAASKGDSIGFIVVQGDGEQVKRWVTKAPRKARKKASKKRASKKAKARSVKRKKPVYAARKRSGHAASKRRRG